MKTNRNLAVPLMWLCLALALFSTNSGCGSAAPPASESKRIGNRSQAITLPEGFVEEEVGAGWDGVTGLTFSATGRMFVWEKAGRVWEVGADGVRRGQPLIDLHEEVGNWRDYGLLGFALHPNFENNGYIYLLYVVDYHHLKYFGTPSYNPNTDTYYTDTIGRLTRYRARASDNFTTVDPSTRTVLVGESIDTGCPILHESHGVGSLVFGDDGSLLVACGDAASYNRVDSGVVTERPATGLADGIIRPQEDVGAFRAQLVNSLNGKVLRLDPATGDGMVGNPFFDPQNPRAPQSRVWALGLRNPFRMVLRPETGEHDPIEAKPGALYIGDVGWNAWEELNVANAPAQNFGWPLFEGAESQTDYVPVDQWNQDAANPLLGTTPPGQPPCTQAFFKFGDLLKQDSANPVAFPNPCAPAQSVPSGVPTFVHHRPELSWYHGGPTAVVPSYNAAGNPTTKLIGSAGGPTGTPFYGTCAVTGAWYEGSDFPPEYANTLFQADYTSGWIKNLVFDDDNKLIASRDFVPPQVAPVVAMATHPLEGGLYYVSYAGSVRRIRYVGGGNRPPVAVASADAGYGPGPLTVQLTGSASRDPEMGALTYSWDFGDGSPLGTSADVVHTFGTSGVAAQSFQVRLTVTDVQGLSASTTLPVVVNDTPPRVTISQPVADGVFSPTTASAVQLVALPEDDEDAAAALTCSWQVIFHHNTHTHLEPAALGCTQTVQLSPVACGDETYFFEFKVDVTDTAGLKATRSTTLYPDCLPRLVSPMGPTPSNEFRWRPVNGADAYTLWVNDSSGSGVVDAVVTPAEAGCADNVTDCVFSPIYGFAAGPAEFRVRAHSSGSGWRAWSAFQSFQVLAGSCFDQVQNQGETQVDCDGPCTPCSLVCQQNRLSLQAAEASSAESDAMSASFAIDGDAGTRWSTAPGDPQWLSVDLGAVMRVKQVVLKWETAASSNYEIQVATSAAGPWTSIFNEGAGDGGVDTVSGLNANARYVRVYSNARLTPYGVSLWEVEVYGDVRTACGSSCGNGTPNPGEQCDDGNTVDNDACSNACQVATCTDGIWNQGEAGLDCGGPCALPCLACGNGVVQPGEACDDGNAVDNDACSNACVAATCTDGVQNQGELSLDCGGPCAPCGPTCAQARLTPASASASSTENGSSAAANAIDNNLGSRWASSASDPQWLQLDLGAARRIKQLILRWEFAASADYDIQTAPSASGPWTTIYHQGSGAGGVETISGLNASSRYLRLYSNERLTPFGVSLWELEVYGDTNATCGTTCGNGVLDAGEQCDDANFVNDDSCSNACVLATCGDGVANQGETGVDCGGPCAQLCTVCGNGVVQAGEACDDGNAVDNDTCSNTCVLATCSDQRQNQGEVGVDCGGPCPACALTCNSNKLTPTTATASSAESGAMSATQAIDGAIGTRWSTGPADPQWLLVDLGGARRVKRVVLRWEAAYSSNYDIQVSDSASGPWSTIFHDGAGVGGTKDITGLNASARYVRMYSNARGTPYGVSLWELEVYGDLNPTCGSTCGNGAPDAGEQCDDANSVNTDSCNNLCQLNTCTDGIANQGETGVDCGGPCAQVCTICGNGVVQGSEQCDDGNLVNNDSCSNACISATCADGAQNQGEVGVDCGGPCAACALTCADNKLTISEATSSSEEGGQSGAAFAVDNSLGTRWSSAAFDPQWLRLDLGGERRIKRVILRWEFAASLNYDIQIAASLSGPWTTIHHQSNGAGGVEEITGLNASSRYLRLYSNSRRTPYGVSLWEIEVYGDVNASCGSPCGNGTIDAGEECDDGNSIDDDSCTRACLVATCTDGARNQGETGIDCGGPCGQVCVVCGNGVVQLGEACDDGNAIDNDACSNQCVIATCSDARQNQGETGVDCGGPCGSCALVCADAPLTPAAAAASSQEQALYAASAAIDGSLATRWSSAFADPQWIRVDLGAQRRIKRVILNWEAASSRVYDVQVSDSTSGPWTTVFHDGAGTGGVKTITGLNANARYVRVNSTARNTPFGVSLFEFQVYGDPSPTCGP